MTAELRQQILALIDAAIDWCIEHWRALIVMVPAGTFIFFALLIFFGMTVAESVAGVRVLVAVEIALTGAILVLNLRYRRQLNRRLDAADAMDALLSDDDVFSDWEEFINTPARDPEVETIRRHCMKLPEVFPPEASREYCNEQGVKQLEAYMTRLRCGLATRAVEGCVTWWEAWRKANKRAKAEAAEPIAAGLDDDESMPEEPAEMPPAASMPGKTAARSGKTATARKKTTAKKSRTA